MISRRYVHSTTLWIILIALTIAGLGTRPAFAADAPVKPFHGDPYPLDSDPVSGQPLGDKPILYTHEDREFRFTDQKSLDAFKADPKKYIPAVDQKMIAQQLPFYPLDTCIVSGEKLGEDMGKPIDLIYKNRLVRFCCASCPGDFKKSPDKFIAAIDAAVIAKQSPKYPMTTCPVTGEKLDGDMGPPVDLVAGNRLIRFCCGSCPKDFKKTPLKYFKMLDDAQKKAGN